MPSRRDSVRMTDAEAFAWLAAQPRIALVTNGPHGLPHPVPMNFGMDEAGRLILTAFARSQKVRNLERDSRAALMAESGETYAELRGVIAYADAEILREPDDIARLMPMVRAAGDLASSISAPMNEQVRASLAKRVILRFTPFRFISWDHSRLGGAY